MPSKELAGVFEPGTTPSGGFLHALSVELRSYLHRYAGRKVAFPSHARDSPRRARRLLDLLGAPDRCLPIVHVIGTKGKGSTAAILESILRAAGRRTGLYTSPHLHSPRERIRIQGALISRPAFAGGCHRLLPLLEESLSWDDLGPATLFEGLTALALQHFVRYGVEVAIVEAGMGGQSDATAALTPILTLLTPVSLDHQAHLGETLSAIAAEKVGVVPPGGLVLSAPQPDEAWGEILRHCRAAGASLRRADPSPLEGPGLAGRHQEVNAGLALAAAGALRERGWEIPDEAVAQGLREVRWPGRLEVVASRPLTIVDVAHNPASAQALAESLLALFPRRPCLFLLGCSADKDLAGIVAALAPLADGAVAARAHHYRAADPHGLASLWHRHDVPAEVVPEVREALERIRMWAGPGGLVCACGSFFVVAEVREALGLAVREDWPEPIVPSKNFQI